ncbi:MAG TPA: hypothetical protein VF950_02145 [Planctomycetota bacterium]
MLLFAVMAVQAVDAPVVLRKLPVADCRILRGFAGEPVDGTLKSSDHWFGRVREYPKAAGAYGWSYNDADGLHITLADDRGFDLVVLRGGSGAEMVADATHVARAGDGKRLWTFPGGTETQVARLPETARTTRVSFFKVTGGRDASIGDVAFYRFETPDTRGPAETWVAGDALDLPAPASPFDVGSVAFGMNERYPKEARRAVALKPGAAGAALTLDQTGVLHLVTEPWDVDRGLAAVGIEAKLPGGSRATLVIQDPLSPRRDLAWVPVTVPAGGDLRVTVDLPDQVMLKGTRLWITLLCGPSERIAGLVVLPRLVPREVAVPEALAHRKFLMRALFGPQSEGCEWMFRKPGVSREDFYAQSPRRSFLPELFNTIDQCGALGPSDDLVRQFREWVFPTETADKLVALPPPPAPPEGVPDWAWVARRAWLEDRRVIGHWLEDRVAPSGELGGGVQDDGDVYSELADLPFLEVDGVGGKLRDAGARLAELADRETLIEGVNKVTRDATHAYEDGLDHLALMTRWFYGDPIYFERCMESARSVQKLTVLMPDGRRHFRNLKLMGHKQIQEPPPLGVDGYTTPWMWHTALQTAEYNRNPLALKVVREWADTWLKYATPREWPVRVDVASGKVLEALPDEPMGGGHGSFGLTFTWLYKLTGDVRYVEPLLQSMRKGKVEGYGTRAGGMLHAWGALDGLDAAALAAVAASRHPNALRLRGDPAPLVRQMIGVDRPNGQDVMNLMGSRRFPDMATVAPQATDRFLRYTAMMWATHCYLGGASRRSQYVPDEAVSWEGFGTDYGALVVRNRRDGLKALVYSFAERPMTGAFRVWELAHGEYRIKAGSASDVTRELVRGDRLALTLAPKAVTVLEIVRTRELEPIYGRADLAIAAREVEIRGDTLSGTAHNIGSSSVEDAAVAVVDAEGKVVVRQSLGAIEAPLDLLPRRKPFTLKLPAGERKGWRLRLDPDGAVPEIYEGNNEVPLDDLPAVDYRKGWD